MLMLKGNTGKSKFIYNLIGRNLCFEYCEDSIGIGEYWMSSLNHSLEEYKDYIKACLYEEDKSNKDNLYEYLIIYTNEREEDLEDFISWIKDNERWFLCANVLITCK